MLSDEELDRYARHIVLPQVGGAGQLRLKSARIAIVGAGGIGAGFSWSRRRRSLLRIVAADAAPLFRR